MVFRYHLSVKLLINTAVVIFFCKMRDRAQHCFVYLYILRYDFDLFLIMITQTRKIEEFLQILINTLIIGPGIAHGFKSTS
jgi:hypothetical protein